jgi:hypothetical protein
MVHSMFGSSGWKWSNVSGWIICFKHLSIIVYLVIIHDNSTFLYMKVQ